MNTKRKTKLVARLDTPLKRAAFVAAHIQTGVPFQIRALREQRRWKQATVAEKSGMSQAVISRLENPDYGSSLTIKTLRRLASAFDVALIVRFVSFGELIEWIEGLSPVSLNVPSFADDPQCRSWTAAAGRMGNRPTETAEMAAAPIFTAGTLELASFPGSAQNRTAGITNA